LFSKPIYCEMASKVTKYIDKLIESELTNMVNFADKQSTAPDITAMINKSFSEPVTNFLDVEEKEEQDKITYNNKAKSIDNDKDRRRVRDHDINQSKEAIKKINKLRADLEASKEQLRQQQLAAQVKLKADMEQGNNNDNNLDVIRQQIAEHIKESFGGMPDIKKYDAMPIITRKNPVVQKVEEAAPMPVPAAAPVPAQIPSAIDSRTQPKIIKVNFDTKTAQPFQVEFSERGFLIGSTRLSFEIIETALSKNFTITLDNGAGLVLDAIKMQKIMKYKDRV